MKLKRKNILIISSFIGGLLGYLVIHPMSMVIQGYINQSGSPLMHFLMSFKINHFEMTSYFIILGIILGAVIGLFLFKSLANENKFKELFNNINSGVVILLNINNGRDFIIKDYNNAGKQMDGTKKGKLLGKNVCKIFPEIKNTELLNTLSRVYKTGKPEHLPTTLFKNNGSSRWKKYFIYKLPSGEVVVVYEDITKQKRDDDIIKHLSFHDYLTGIYNRAFFEEEIKRLDTKRKLPMSIILGDVNGLKIINDAFGHEKGDELLRKIAKILKSSFRSEDIVARWGGDEFIAILPNTKLKDSLEIISRVKERCKKESTKIMPLSISFGISVKEDIWQNITEVIKSAEDKMYRHKLTEMQSTHNSIISSLGKALEERDYDTEEHVLRVKKIAISLGKRLKLPQEKIDELNLLSTLHDIGKIAIADSIILKPRSLTKEEWKIVKKHSEIGYRIAEASPDLAPIAKGILYHHEWWNGKGYPSGLKGENIPLISRIISIIDAYDAMTNDRPYREALSKEEALEELKKLAGTQFDPDIVEQFLKINAEKKIKVKV